MSETIVLGSPIQCSDARAGLSFLRPRVSGLVLDPSTTRLDYIVVHRGFIGGQDQSVPSAYLAAAQPGEVSLQIDRNTLKEMPPLEVRLPDQGFAQRSFSEESVLLSQATLVTNESGQTLGHFYGLVVAPDHQLEQILLDGAGHPGIPVTAIASCGESCIQVQDSALVSATSPATPPAAEPAPGTMVRDPVCDMELPVDSALRAEHRGEVYYFCSLACKRTFEQDPPTYAAKARTV